MTRADTIEAVNYIEQSKHTHIEWVRWLGGAKSCGCEECRDWLKNAIPIAGDIEHHMESIRKYDHVLSVLKSIGPLA